MLMQNNVEKINNRYKDKRLSPFVIIVSISFSVIILIGGWWLLEDFRI